MDTVKFVSKRSFILLAIILLLTIIGANFGIYEEHYFVTILILVVGSEYLIPLLYEKYKSRNIGSDRVYNFKCKIKSYTEWLLWVYLFFYATTNIKVSNMQNGFSEFISKLEVMEIVNIIMWLGLMVIIRLISIKVKKNGVDFYDEGIVSTWYRFIPYDKVKEVSKIYLVDKIRYDLKVKGYFGVLELVGNREDEERIDLIMKEKIK